VSTLDWRAGRLEFASGNILDTGRVRLWYHDDGAPGDPLVLLGGFSVGHFQFDPVRPYLAGRRLITWEPRGFGPSDAPSGPYSVEIWADDLRSLLDGLGIERAHVWGHAFGGYIALCFAARNPERTGSLIAFPDVWAGDPARAYAKIWRIYGAIIEEFGTKGFGARALAHFYDVSEPEWAPRWIAAAIEEVIHPETANATIGWGCLNGDVRPYLRQIEAPTLALHGTGGWTGERADFDLSLSLMQRDIGNLEIAAVEGHVAFFTLQRPAETGGIVADFIRRHPLR
jgi:pimeloyl-ACP methyl ester carboxylesterase